MLVIMGKNGGRYLIRRGVQIRLVPGSQQFALVAFGGDYLGKSIDKIVIFRNRHVPPVFALPKGDLVIKEKIHAFGLERVHPVNNRALVAPALKLFVFAHKAMPGGNVRYKIAGVRAGGLAFHKVPCAVLQFFRCLCQPLGLDCKLVIEQCLAVVIQRFFPVASKKGMAIAKDIAAHGGHVSTGLRSLAHRHPCQFLLCRDSVRLAFDLLGADKIGELAPNKLHLG